MRLRDMLALSLLLPVSLATHHAFDSPLARLGFRDPTFQASLNCLRREIDGVLVNAETGAAFSYADACVTYGPTAQYDAAAAEKQRPPWLNSSAASDTGPRPAP